MKDLQSIKDEINKNIKNPKIILDILHKNKNVIGEKNIKNILAFAKELEEKEWWVMFKTYEDLDKAGVHNWEMLLTIRGSEHWQSSVKLVGNIKASAALNILVEAIWWILWEIISKSDNNEWLLNDVISDMEDVAMQYIIDARKK